MTFKLKKGLPLNELKESQYCKVSKKKHTRPRQVNSFRSVMWCKPITKETLMIYENGKVVLLGCKSLAQGTEVVAWLLNTIANAEIECELKQHNIVAHGKLETSLDFEETLHKLWSRGRHAFYEPELSASLKYHWNNARCLLFQNGKAILTGIKTENELEEFVNIIQEDLHMKFVQ